MTYIHMRFPLSIYDKPEFIFISKRRDRNNGFIHAYEMNVYLKETVLHIPTSNGGIQKHFYYMMYLWKVKQWPPNFLWSIKYWTDVRLLFLYELFRKFSFSFSLLTAFFINLSSNWFYRGERSYPKDRYFDSFLVQSRSLEKFCARLYIPMI